MYTIFSPMSIAHWAARNVRMTRFLLVLAHALLSVLAYKMGYWLWDLNISLPTGMLWLTMAFSLFIFFVYPSKSVSSYRFTKKANFVFRKTLDGLLTVCTFLMILQQSNQAAELGNIPFLNSLESSIQASFPSKIKSDESEIRKGLRVKKRGFLHSFFKWKERKNVLENKFRNRVKNSRTPSNGEKILFTILGVVGAIFLFYLVAFAACSLSCNGAETAGTIVAIVGVAGILFLFFLLMKHLYRKKPEETTV